MESFPHIGFGRAQLHQQLQPLPLPVAVSPTDERQKPGRDAAQKLEVSVFVFFLSRKGEIAKTPLATLATVAALKLRQLVYLIMSPKKIEIATKQDRIHGISRLPSSFPSAEKRGYGPTD